MPLKIVRNNLVNMEVDAVANTANPNPVIDSGVDSEVHAKLVLNYLLRGRKSATLILSCSHNFRIRFDAKYVGTYGRTNLAWRQP